MLHLNRVGYKELFKKSTKDINLVTSEPCGLCKARCEKLNLHYHSAAGEESPVFLSFQKTLKNENLHYIQDDKKVQIVLFCSRCRILCFSFQIKKIKNEQGKLIKILEHSRRKN